MPCLDGDPELLRTLLWTAFVAVARSNPPRAAQSKPARGARPAIVRLRVKIEGRGLQMRIGRFGKLTRGAGAEELVLARRLARRLGLSFCLVERRGGRRDLRLSLAAVPAPRAREPEPQASIS